MSDTYGIAELAREFDVTTRTIRFYEDKGLLAPVREGQRRVYTPRDRVRLRLIMRGKRLGFSLDEIHQLIDLYDVDPSEVTQLRHFLDKIHERKCGAIELLQKGADLALDFDTMPEDKSGTGTPGDSGDAQDEAPAQEPTEA